MGVQLETSAAESLLKLLKARVLHWFQNLAGSIFFFFLKALCLRLRCFGLYLYMI